MSNTVDTSPERLADLERNIEEKLAVKMIPANRLLEYKGDINNNEDSSPVDEEEVREKISVWFGGVLAGAFVFFSEKIAITKEQGATLGSVWGRVVGKWYPQSWLDRTEQAGDTVSAFEPEAVAVKETWCIFGERLLTKLQKRHLNGDLKNEPNGEQTPFETAQNGENAEMTNPATSTSNAKQTAKNAVSDDGLQFPATMGSQNGY